MLTVIKRDGCRTVFDAMRIELAVMAAMKASGHEDALFAKKISEDVFIKFEVQKDVNIFEIQQEVENRLMASDYKSVARHYIEYRHDRDNHRDNQSKLSEDIRGLMENTNALILNENANKDSNVIPVKRDILAGIISKHYAKNHILPKDVVDAHEKGELHYHDLDYSPFFPMFNCMLVDLDRMLNNGFKMGNAEIGSPKSIQTAAAVTAQIVAQVASHTYGGTTLNRLDEVLAKYVTMSYEKHMITGKKWNVPELLDYAMAQTEKEVNDAFQSLEYELNTLFSSNGQVPFLSIGFGLGVSWESRLIQKAIFDNRIAGLGKSKKTAIFPKLVFTIRDGVNLKPTDPNYDLKRLALECASKRMYPDIINYDKVVEVTGSFKAPMGCRSFLDRWVDEDGKEVHEGRNNLGVVSLNLPRIAIEANGSEKAFYEILDRRLILARKALDTRIARFSGIKANVAPVLYLEGACGVRLAPDDDISELFKNGRASISLGFIGINETINALYGTDVHIFDSKVLQLKAIAIVEHLKSATLRWRKETGYGFSLYSTPSENLCGRFCDLDSKQFGVIDGVTDKGYYTNSFHLDVEKKANPYDKIDFESAFPSLSSGGFICYGEFPNMERNLDALEQVWDYSYKHVPYYGTNTPIDECYECGFTGEFTCKSKGFVCPKCGNHNPDTVSVTRRVCGYLGNPASRPFNPGKIKETIKRVKHL